MDQGVLIRQLQGMLEGRAIRAGVETLTFTASTDSAAVVVTHGLGKTPVAVVATSLSAAAFGRIPNCNVSVLTSTTFTLNAEVKTAFTGTVTVSWVALG